MCIVAFFGSLVAIELRSSRNLATMKTCGASSDNFTLTTQATSSRDTRGVNGQLD